MKFLLLSALFFSALGLSQAQYAKLTILDNEQPLAYYHITVSQQDVELGTGQTDAQGFVEIYCPGLQGSAIDVEGKGQKANGANHEWSIKGPIRLNSRKSATIDLGVYTNEMNAKADDLKRDADGFQRNAEKQMEDARRRMDEQRSMLDDLDKNSLGGNSFGGSNDADQFGDDKNGSDRSRPGAISGSYTQQLQRLKNEMSQTEKERMALKLADNPLSTTQIQEILGCLMSELSKEKVAIKAYKNCTDQRNYYPIIDSFQSTIMRRRIEEKTVGR